MQEICQISANLKEEGQYHVMGMEDTKYVLDHTAHIEEWPKNIWRPDVTCVKKKTDSCVHKKCGKFVPRKSSKYKSCARKNRQRCEDEKKGECITGFGSYLSDMATGQLCERDDVCY